MLSRRSWRRSFVPAMLANSAGIGLACHGSAVGSVLMALGGAAASGAMFGYCWVRGAAPRDGDATR